MPLIWDAKLVVQIPVQMATLYLKTSIGGPNFKRRLCADFVEKVG